VQHHGEQLLGVTRALGHADLSNVDAPDVAFFHLPLLGLVRYPGGVSYALSLVLLVGLAGAFLMVRRGGGSALGVGVGAALGLVVSGGVATGGHFAFPVLARRHPE